jgi:hypothetical protein
VSLKPRIAPLLLAAGAAASVAGAPIAVADGMPLPVAGNESASATIQDLEAHGYDVAINWVRGYSTVSLSQCSVDAIHNPDRPPGSQRTPATVFVDVSCPNDWN